MSQNILHFIDDLPIKKEIKTDFKNLLLPIISTSIHLKNKLSEIGLNQLGGSTNSKNSYGEIQQKLDIYANDLFIQSLKKCDEINAIASEENESIIDLKNNTSGYVIALDPMDGSSNINVNIPVGTIFSIQKALYKDNLKNFMQPGKQQILAGYIMYGAATYLTISFGKNTHLFILTNNEFILVEKNFKTPKTGNIYSINESNENSYHKGIYRFISDLKKNSNITSRFIGSMVSDVHRNLIKGGIFCYPAIKGFAEGKLRLIFESNPMAMLVEQAGGKSSNGQVSILELKPKHLHQRIPTIMGSKAMVEDIVKSIKNTKSV